MVRVTELTVHQNHARGGFDVYLRGKDDDLSRLYYGKVQWVACQEGVADELVFVSDMGSDKGVIQALVESLWLAGVRPMDVHTNSGVLASKDDHIKSLTNILEAVLPSALKKVDL